MENNIEKQKTETDLRYPAIGNFVHWHIYQNKIKKADISRSLGILPKGLTAYLKRESLQFEILWKMSLIMKHNFLAQLGEYLPHRFESQRERALLKELAEKNALILKQEIQLEVYRDMLKR